MLHYKVYRKSDLFGVFYTFPLIGDMLPMHDHANGRKHNCIVLKGSVEVYGPDKTWYILLHQGDVFDFNDPEHYPHEIRAMEDDTQIFSITYDGVHPDDEELEDGQVGTLLKDENRPWITEWINPKRL